MKGKDDEIKASLINIEKKEEQTDEENDKANKAEDTEEIHKADIENSSNTFIESKLETYCPECDIIFRLGELLIYRNHCAVRHGWFPCENSYKREGCDFTTTTKTDLAEHKEDCDYK